MSVFFLLNIFLNQSLNEVGKAPVFLLSLLPKRLLQVGFNFHMQYFFLHGVASVLLKGIW